MKEGAPHVSPRIEQTEESLTPHEKDVVYELAYPLHRILNQIEPELEEGAYALLIGDDVSGRIPSIVMNEAVRRIYKAYGHPAPMLRFVAGGSRSDLEDDAGEKKRKEEMYARTASMNDELIKTKAAPRALVITEAVSSGEGMRMLIEALRNEHIKTDIATVSFIGVEQHDLPLKEVQKQFKDVRIIAGSQEVLPKVYGKNMRYLHGVAKEDGSATAQRLTDHLAHEESIPVTQAKINAVRVLATKVGSELADIYLMDKQKDRP